MGMAIRMSNNVTRVLHLATLLLSVPVLAAGVWLRSRAEGAGCDRSLSTPAIALGAALTAVSLAGLVGACCRLTWLLWLHLLAMPALILALLCFTAFALAVTADNGAGEAGYTGYSTWLRRRVEGRENWARIRSCLAGERVCKRLGDGSKNATRLARLGGMSPVESGCCRPPASCNLTHAGEEAASLASADPDCGAWGSDGDELCYGCRSCKAGVAGALRRDWRRAAVVDAVFLAVIVVVYSVGCCAFGNSRRDNYVHHSGRRWKQSRDNA